MHGTARTLSGSGEGLAEDLEFQTLRALNRYDRFRAIQRFDEAGETIPLKSIGISVTENCQLRCRWCHIVEIGFNKTYMDIADFRKLLESCSDLESINLTPRGEAFLHPQFIDILKVCRDVHPKAKTRVITNGIYSLGGGRSDLPKYLDFVAFSVDGATKETYELIRKPAKWENFIESVKRFVAYKEEHKTDAIYRFVFTAAAPNLPELPQLVDLAAELRHIESIFVSPMRLRTQSMMRFEHELLDAMPDAERFQILERAKARAKEVGVGLNIAKNCYPNGHAGGVDEETDEDEAQAPGRENLKYLEFCREPWNNGMRVGQRLFPCCYMPAHVRANPEISTDLADRYGFGVEIADYASIGIDDFYNSDGFWRFRRDIMEGRAERYCGNCTIAKESYQAFAKQAETRLDPTIAQEQVRKLRQMVNRQKQKIEALQSLGTGS